MTKDRKHKDGKLADSRVRDGSLTWLDMTDGKGLPLFSVISSY